MAGAWPGRLAPSSSLALAVARVLRNPRAARWRFRLLVGLRPLTVALMLAGGVVLARTADHSVVAAGITVVSTLILLQTRLHPLLLMAGAAVLGLLGLV